MAPAKQDAGAVIVGIDAHICLMFGTLIAGCGKLTFDVDIEFAGVIKC